MAYEFHPTNNPIKYQNGNSQQGTIDANILQGGTIEDILLNIEQARIPTGDKDQIEKSRTDLLNYLLEKDKRQYNEDMRDYDNEYNSPKAQIERLMAAGMSYAQAVAAVSGAGESSGAEGAAPVSEPVLPSQTELNQAQSSLANAQRAFGIFGAASNFAGLGMQAAQLGVSIPAIASQTQAQQIANAVAFKTQRGLELAGQYGGLMNEIFSKNTGMFNRDDYPDRATAHDKMLEFAYTDYSDDPEFANADLWKRTRDFVKSQDFVEFMSNPWAQQQADAQFVSYSRTADPHYDHDLAMRNSLNLEKQGFFIDANTKLTEQQREESVSRWNLNNITSRLTKASAEYQEMENSIKSAALEPVTQLVLFEAKRELDWMLHRYDGEEGLKKWFEDKDYDRDMLCAMARLTIDNSNFEYNWNQDHPNSRTFSQWSNSTGFGQILGSLLSTGAQIYGTKKMSGAIQATRSNAAAIVAEGKTAGSPVRLNPYDL